MNKRAVSVLAIIPARYASSRFPGKLLQEVANKPLLQWVIEGVRESHCLNGVVVATDHKDIAQLAEGCGVQVVMTPSELPSGTDRIWAALQILERKSPNPSFPSISPIRDIINVQGDEPLISGELIDDLYASFCKYQEVDMITLARSIENKEELDSPHCVKVVRKANGEALYFSRFPIPYSRTPSTQNISSTQSTQNTSSTSPPPSTPNTQNSNISTETETEEMSPLLHIGIYGYRRKCLQEFCQQKPTLLEQREGLEQLRALYLNKKIQVLHRPYKSIGVDKAQDLAKVEQLLIEKEKGRHRET